MSEYIVFQIFYLFLKNQQQTPKPTTPDSINSHLSLPIFFYCRFIFYLNQIFKKKWHSTKNVIFLH